MKWYRNLRQEGELPFSQEFLTDRERERQFFGDPCDYKLAERALAAYLLELGKELVQGDGHVASGLVKVIDDLADSRKRMYHCGDGTYPVQSVQAVDGLRHVGKADQDTVPRPDSQSMQRTRHQVDVPCHLSVSDRLSHECQGRESGFRLRGIEHRFGHCLFTVIKDGGYAVIAVLPRA